MVPDHEAVTHAAYAAVPGYRFYRDNRVISLPYRWHTFILHRLRVSMMKELKIATSASLVATIETLRQIVRVEQTDYTDVAAVVV